MFEQRQTEKSADLYKQDSGEMLQGEKNKEKLFKAAKTQEGKVLQIKQEMAKQTLRTTAEEVTNTNSEDRKWTRKLKTVTQEKTQTETMTASVRQETPPCFTVGAASQPLCVIDLFTITFTQVFFLSFICLS